MTDLQKLSVSSVLTAALHNAKVVENQVSSLNDDYPMPEVVKELSEAIKAIEKALAKLNG